MPRIGSGGIVAGVAAQVSLETFPIAERGTCASWLSSDIVIANRLIGQPDTWALQVYDGDEWRSLEAPAGNHLAAGGGQWLGWRSGTGLYNDAISWSAAGLAGPDLVVGRGAAAADGTLGVILNRQAGFPVELWRADGTTVRLPDAAAGTLGIGSRDVAVWVEGGQIRAFGLPDPAPQAEPAVYARPIALGGAWLLLVTTNERVWLRWWTQALGVVVVPGPYGFAADALTVDPATVRVCWSVTSGERPEDIRFADVSVSSLTVPVAPPVPPDPQPEPEPPEPEPEPPDPTPEPEPEPEPSRPYRAHKEHPMADDTLGVLRGPGGRLARPDAPNTGPWAQNPGWRGLVFDGTDAGDTRYHFWRPGDRPTALISVETGAVLGCDATLHSGGLAQQFYLKPDGDTSQGWAEAWQFYDGNANGAIEAQVEYGPGYGGDDGPFFSYPLAFEVLT